MNRNLTVTDVPYSRCRAWLLLLSAVTFVLSFITYAVIALPVGFPFKLFGRKLDLTSPFSRNMPERVIPRLYLPIERFYKYTFRDLPYYPEQNAFAAEIPEKSITIRQGQERSIER